MNFNMLSELDQLSGLSLPSTLEFNLNKLEEGMFYDAIQNDDEHLWYVSESYACQIKQETLEEEMFYDMDNSPWETKQYG